MSIISSYLINCNGWKSIAIRTCNVINNCTSSSNSIIKRSIVNDLKDLGIISFQLFLFYFIIIIIRL